MAMFWKYALMTVFALFLMIFIGMMAGIVAGVAHTTYRAFMAAGEDKPPIPDEGGKKE